MPVHCCIRCKNNGPDFKKKSFKWKEVIAWSMLDFSNSVVLMVILGQYTTFLESIIYAPNGREATNNLMYSNIVISIITFIISPPIGVFIDKYFIRIPIIIVTIIGYSVASMALFAVKAGDKILPIVMYAFTMFFFRLNEMVTGAFLPSLCNDRDMGFVSSFGYFIGFLSGVIIFLIIKLFTTPPRGSTDPVGFRINGFATTMMITGIIQLLAGLPPMLMLDNGIPEGEKRPKFTRKSIPDSFKENARTIRNSFKINRTLTMILLCYILVSIGVQTFVSFGLIVLNIYSSPYGVTINDLQDCGLYYNCAVAVFSLVFALISKSVSSYILVLVSYIIVIVGCSSTFWYRAIAQTPSFNPGFFWVWFVFVMFSVSAGPLQALIRGAVGFLTPDAQKGEIFGCLESMIILGNVIGSTIPSLLIYLNHWAFFLWIAVFLVLAMILWIFIPVMKEEKKVIERMREEDARKANEENTRIADKVQGVEVVAGLGGSFEGLEIAVEAGSSSGSSSGASTKSSLSSSSSSSSSSTNDRDTD